MKTKLINCYCSILDSNVLLTLRLLCRRGVSDAAWRVRELHSAEMLGQTPFYGFSASVGRQVTVPFPFGVNHYEPCEYVFISLSCLQGCWCMWHPVEVLHGAIISSWHTLCVMKKWCGNNAQR